MGWLARTARKSGSSTGLWVWVRVPMRASRARTLRAEVVVDSPLRSAEAARSGRRGGTLGPDVDVRSSDMGAV
ncbi:hypothetical protein GCM10027270_11620 [Nocardioides ginkgobilobae]